MSATGPGGDDDYFDSVTFGLRHRSGSVTRGPGESDEELRARIRQMGPVGTGPVARPLAGPGQSPNACFGPTGAPNYGVTGPAITMGMLMRHQMTMAPMMQATGSVSWTGAPSGLPQVTAAQDWRAALQNLAFTHGVGPILVKPGSAMGTYVVEANGDISTPADRERFERFVPTVVPMAVQVVAFEYLTSDRRSVEELSREFEEAVEKALGR